MQAKRLNYSVLIASMLIGALLSVWLGKDLNWDLANYHYYNPYALLHGRYTFDYWPAGVHTFFNPTLDLLTYFLITHLPPLLIGFLLGALQGITIWLIFRLALLFLPPEENHPTFAVLLAGIGAYCPQFLTGIGTHFGDLNTGLLVLIAIYLQIKFFQAPQTQLRLLLASGLFCGMAVGLKLTTSFYLVGAGCALLISSTRPLREGFYWGMSAVFGIVLTGGYWMLFLWDKFHNPVFPFFNAIFHAPGFPLINWHDVRFLPKTLWQAIFYPAYFAWGSSKTDDIAYHDLRFLFAYILFLSVGVQWIWQKLKRKKVVWLREKKWFICFFLLSYLSWEVGFSYMRYAVILAMLTPLVIYLLFNQLMQRFLPKFILLTAIYYSIVLSVATATTERAPWDNRPYFGINIPTQILAQPRATVLLAVQDYQHMNDSPLSLAYLIPSFPAQWRFIGVPYIVHSTQNTLAPELVKIIAQAAGPFYLLATEDVMPGLRALTQQLGMGSQGQCQVIPITRRIFCNKQVLLCPMRR